VNDISMFPWTKRRHDEARGKLLLLLWRDLHDVLLPVLLDTHAAAEMGETIKALMAVAPPSRANGRVSAAKRRIAAHIRLSPKAAAVDAVSHALGYGVVSLWLESQTLDGADALAVHEETEVIINTALRETPQP
jgi:hypothetical protein